MVSVLDCSSHLIYHAFEARLELPNHMAPLYFSQPVSKESQNAGYKSEGEQFNKIVHQVPRAVQAAKHLTLKVSVEPFHWLQRLLPQRAHVYGSDILPMACIKSDKEMSYVETCRSGNS